MNGPLVHSEMDPARSANPAAQAGARACHSPDSPRTRKVFTGQRKLSPSGVNHVAAACCRHPLGAAVTLAGVAVEIGRVLPLRERVLIARLPPAIPRAGGTAAVVPKTTRMTLLTYRSRSRGLVSCAPAVDR